MVKELAAEELFWEPGSRHGYHAFTIGALADELIRRATGAGLPTLSPRRGSVMF